MKAILVGGREMGKLPVVRHALSEDDESQGVAPDVPGTTPRKIGMQNDQPLKLPYFSVCSAACILDGHLTNGMSQKPRKGGYWKQASEAATHCE